MANSNYRILGNVLRIAERNLLILFLVPIFIYAFVLRLYVLVASGGVWEEQIDWAMVHYFGGLSGYYVSSRDVILAGQPHLLGVIYPPGYSIFLAILDLLGAHDLRSVRILQGLLDAASVFPLAYIVYFLTKSRPFIILAAALYAVAPWWAQGSTFLLAESPMTALVIWTLAAMIWARGREGSLAPWIILGLVAAVPSMFRSAMTLLVGPLVLWALMSAPRGRRLLSAFVTGITFLTPLMAWAIWNFYNHGLFMLTAPAKWYAMWSGLGQIPNELGFYVSDLRAGMMLQELGIRAFTQEAEDYFRHQYMMALAEYPWHVIQSIFYRFELIIAGDSYAGPDFRWIRDLFYGWLPWLVPVAVGGLLLRRRIAEAFVLAGPMAYALLTLGIMYVETRYVRYTGITTLLSLLVVCSFLVEYAGRLKLAKHVVWRRHAMEYSLGLVGAAFLLVYGVLQTLAIQAPGRAQVSAAGLDWDSMQQFAPTLILENMDFTPIVPTVETEPVPAGVRVWAQEAGYNYLLMQTLLEDPPSSREAVVATIDYRVELGSAGITIGVLSSDQSRWLAAANVVGAAGSVQEGQLQSALESQSKLVIAAIAPGDDNVDVVIEDLTVTVACVDGSLGLLEALFRRDGPLAGHRCAGSRADGNNR